MILSSFWIARRSEEPFDMTQAPTTLTARSAVVLLSLVALTSLTTIAVSWYVQETFQLQYAAPAAAPLSILDEIVSPATADALRHDDQLIRSYGEVLELTRDLSNALAARYHIPSLEQAGELLETYRRGLEEGIADKSKSTSGSVRKFLSARQSDAGSDPLGALFGAGATTTASSAAAATTSASAGSDPLSGLTGSLGSAFSSIGSGLLSDISGAGMFLGIGIGAGAAQGLNLSTADRAKEVGAQVALASGMNATGLNPTIQNAGMGATATLLGSLNVSSLGKNIDLQPIIVSLAEGLGNGTVMGLNLNPSANIVPPAGNDTASIAGGFGYGLSRSVTGNLNLSQMFTSNPQTTAQLVAALPGAASGFGKGLGAGIPIGLGLQPDTPVPSTPTVDGQVDASGIAEGFAQGLTSRLLANGTASKLVASLSNSSSGSGGSGLPGMGHVNIGSVAQGFARGLVQGAGDAVTSIGGVGALINGTAHAPVGALPNSTIAFNDSVGGAAAGFGQGLGGQGVLVARQLLSHSNTVSSSASANNTKRYDHSKEVNAIVVRQSSNSTALASFNGSQGVNISMFLNSQTISSAAQAGVDALTCSGVGGLVGVLLGLVSSGAIPLMSGTPVDAHTASLIKQAVPSGIIEIHNDGNTFDIDGQKVLDGMNSGLIAMASGIKINGQGVVAFAVLLVFHGMSLYTLRLLLSTWSLTRNKVSMGLVAVLTVLPLALGLEGARNILVRIKLGHILPNAPRWNNIMWYFILAPSLILILIFGAVVMGEAGHFRTAHGVSQSAFPSSKIVTPDGTDGIILFSGPRTFDSNRRPRSSRPSLRSQDARRQGPSLHKYQGQQRSHRD